MLTSAYNSSIYNPPMRHHLNNYCYYYYFFKSHKPQREMGRLASFVLFVENPPRLQWKEGKKATKINASRMCFYNLV